jgi:hypothetical protein
MVLATRVFNIPIARGSVQFQRMLNGAALANVITRCGGEL